MLESEESTQRADLVFKDTGNCQLSKQSVFIVGPPYIELTATRHCRKTSIVFQGSTPERRTWHMVFFRDS